MNIFIQGMRRNGTTVLFDLFCEDGGFETWYEPLARVKTNIGGGSGLRKVEYFDNVRAARRFMVERFGDGQEFNWGAPRAPELEFEAGVPEHIRRYLFLLTSLSENTVIKFTRMARKCGVLYELDPDAVFLHVVRDPRLVAASCVFGRGGAARAPGFRREQFFTARRMDMGWSMPAFSNCVMRENGIDCDLCDFERVMLVWKDCYEHTRADAQKMFGSRYMLVRHEDFCRDPAAAVEKIYELLGHKPARTLLDWAAANIRGEPRVFEPDNTAWERAVDRLGLGAAMRECGYQ